LGLGICLFFYRWYYNNWLLEYRLLRC